MARKVDDRAGQLYDYAVSRMVEGFTLEEACDHFGWTMDQYHAAKKRVREILKDEPVNLVCAPDGPRMRWRYRLTGDVEQTSPWSTNRLGDAETRLHTIHFVAQSVQRSVDPTSSEGRKAQEIYHTLGYLLRVLAFIDSAA